MWLKRVNQAALDLRMTITPRDPLFRKCWPLICECRGWTEVHDTDEAAQQRFIAQIGSCALTWRVV